MMSVFGRADSAWTVIDGFLARIRSYPCKHTCLLRESPKSLTYDVHEQSARPSHTDQNHECPPGWQA